MGKKCHLSLVSVSNFQAENVLVSNFLTREGLGLEIFSPFTLVKEIKKKSVDLRFYTFCSYFSFFLIDFSLLSLEILVIVKPLSRLGLNLV